jgi:tRNA(fMet)-specific endonuclease VapC
VRERLEAELTEQRTLFVSAVTLFELWFGAIRSRHPIKGRQQILADLAPLTPIDFDAEDAAAAARVHATLEKEGRRIGAYDTLLAGQALARDLTLVTRNVREFGRVGGLQVESWS